MWFVSDLVVDPETGFPHGGSCCLFKTLLRISLLKRQSSVFSSPEPKALPAVSIKQCLHRLLSVCPPFSKASSLKKNTRPIKAKFHDAHIHVNEETYHYQPLPWEGSGVSTGRGNESLFKWS